jgi:signal transduction histidine kinase
VTPPFAAPDSLRVRLLAGTLVWILASIVIAGWGLTGLFRNHIAIQFHAELKTHLDQLTANLVQDEQGRPSLSSPLSDPRFSRPYSGLYWQIDRMGSGTAPAANGVLRSRSLWDSAIAVPNDTLVSGELQQHRIVGPQGAQLGLIERVVFPENRPDLALRLIVAADEKVMAEPVDRFSGALWLALAVLGAGLVVAAVVQVFIGLSPLRRLRRELAAVRNGDSQRLAGEFPVEISPLVEEFNAVLGQNAEIVARARTQAGNLAHALKTPLSVLANAAAKTGADGGSELARVVLDQVATATRQVDYHLTRARAAAAVNVPGTRTGLEAVTEGLVRVMRHVYADRHLLVSVPPMADGLAFRGEEQDLQEMLGNLLDNACKWARQCVTVQAARVDGKLIVTIDDDGKGIAAEQREAVMGRGVRADEQAPGSGLGLAIVDDLARAYGGQIELGDSPLGGLRATLTLPAA